jgi:hypothetical protein
VPITGLYSIGSERRVRRTNATGYRYVDFKVTFAAGGTATIASVRRAGNSAIETVINVSAVYQFTAGDYVGPGRRPDLRDADLHLA